MSLYEHIPHPHIRARAGQGPVTTAAHRGSGFNARIGLAITTLVGTMICGYVFAVIALLSLPSAISSHNLTIIIAWVSSNFLQLVLLPVIIVGQNVQARASDTRAMQTYEDAEAVLHEALQIQAHLAAQDEKILAILTGISPGTQTAAAQVSGGAGSNPAGAGLPADQRVVPPPAARTSQVAVPQQVLDTIKNAKPSGGDPP